MKTGSENNKVGALKIAFMLISSMVGAGFASGREIWVYFGSFGKPGYAGLVVLFVLYFLSAYISAELVFKLKSGRYEEIITPGGHPGWNKFIKYYILACIWVVILSMSSAGGSLGEEFFGVPKYIGGLVVVILVLLTVLGNFDRVSKVIGYVIPVLMVTLIVTCIYLLQADIPDPGATAVPMHGSLTPTWYIAAFIYMSFSLTGILSINISCAEQAASRKDMHIGILIAAVFLTVLAGLMMSVLTKYPSFTETHSLPLPGYAALVSPVLYHIFTIALMASIYSAATTGYYAFAVAIKEDRYKVIKVIAFAVLGYLLGLMGFKAVVDYVFSIKGIVSILIWVLLIWHFAGEFLVKREKQ